MKICWLLPLLILSSCASAPNSTQLDKALADAAARNSGVPIVLRVATIEDRATDWQPVCDPPPGLTCISPYWYVYRAKVHEVVKGQFDAPEVRFARLQLEGYNNEVQQDFYVILSPANQDQRTRFGVEYIASKFFLKVRGHHAWIGD